MRRFKLVLTILFFLHLSLAAEEIQLKDGTKITGKLVGVKEDTFQVKTAYGDINVPRAQVLTINFPENQPTPAAAEGSLPPIDEALDGASYVNRTASFQLTVPVGWKIAPELRASKDIAAALMSADETLFFMATPEKFAGTIATYKVLAEAQYKSKFSDYQKLSEAPAELDGQTSIRLIFHGTESTSHSAMKFLVYIVPYDGRIVRLTFFTLEPLFDDGTAVFEKMAASYRSTNSRK